MWEQSSLRLEVQRSKKKIQKPAQSYIRALIIAARKKKEQLGAFENTDDISINPASTPRQTGVTRRVSTRQSQTPQQQHTTLQQNRHHSQRLSRRSSPFIAKVPHMDEGYNTPVPKVQVLNCLRMECSVTHCFVMRSYHYVALISEHICTFLTSIIVKKMVLYLCALFEI